jgi:hypothetical protein
MWPTKGRKGNDMNRMSSAYNRRQKYREDHGEYPTKEAPPSQSAQHEVNDLTRELLTFLQKKSNHDALLSAAACGEAMVTLCHVEGIDIDALLEAVKGEDVWVHGGRGKVAS